MFNFFQESTSYQRLPSSFLLELIVINEWKRAGSPEDFDLRKGFYQVLSSITHYRTMRLAYTQHYKFHHCQYLSIVLLTSSLTKCQIQLSSSLVFSIEISVDKRYCHLLVALNDRHSCENNRIRDIICLIVCCHVPLVWHSLTSGSESSLVCHTQCETCNPVKRLRVHLLELQHSLMLPNVEL